MSAKTEHCRDCWQQEPRVYTLAEVIVWGKLAKPHEFGPKCYDHSPDWVRRNWDRLDQCAVYDLRPINAALPVDRGDDVSEPVTITFTSDQLEALGELLDLVYYDDLAKAHLALLPAELVDALHGVSTGP